jgi:hypothetical protein
MKVKIVCCLVAERSYYLLLSDVVQCDEVREG